MHVVWPNTLGSNDYVPGVFLIFFKLKPARVPSSSHDYWVS